MRFESLVPRKWPGMNSSSFINTKPLSTRWSNSRMIIQTGVPTILTSVACCRDQSQSWIVPLMKYRITCQIFPSATKLCHQTLLPNSRVVGSSTLRNPFSNPYPKLIIFVLRHKYGIDQSVPTTFLEPQLGSPNSLVQSVLDSQGDSDGDGGWGCGGGCDWRFGWPSSLDGGLGSLGRGEFTGSELVTLLDAGGHGVTDRGGEVGSKRP